METRKTYSMLSYSLAEIFRREYFENIFIFLILVIEEPAGQPKNRQGPEEAKSYGRRGEKQAAMPKNWHARARDCQQVQHILSSNIFVIEYFCHRIFCYRIFRRRIFCVRVPFCHPIFAVEYFNRIFLSAFFIEYVYRIFLSSNIFRGPAFFTEFFASNILEKYSITIFDEKTPTKIFDKNRR